MTQNNAMVNAAETVNAAQSIITDDQHCAPMTRDEFFNIIEEMRRSLKVESLFANQRKPLMQQRTIRDYVITVLLFPQGKKWVYTYYASVPEGDLSIASTHSEDFIDALEFDFWEYNHIA